MMFIKMNKKYTKRIMGYEEIRPFWYFFDLKAYMIMACMMGGGIGFRARGIFSDIFIVPRHSGGGPGHGSHNLADHPLFSDA